jgi:hypothetical protein
MAIINVNLFPSIGQTQVDLRNNTFHWQLRDWNDGNNYWYCELFNGESFDKAPLDLLIGSDTLDKIKTDSTTYLYINNSHEAFHGIVPWIYKVINKYGIPPNKVYIMTESADLHTSVGRYANEHAVDTINVEWVMVFQANVQELTKDKTNLPNTLKDQDYPKRYLNFNRRWRLHRPSLVALLIAHDLVDYGHISLGIDDTPGGSTWGKVFGWIEHRFSSDLEITELLKKHKQLILNYPPMYLDTEDLVTNQVNITPDTNYLYENSLVSVVSETNFFREFERGRFLSEKTWKPIASNHPFIMVTVPHTLELLQSIGYQTFSPWIDESYDQEPNDILRMKLIVKEIDKISKMSNDEVHTFLEQVRPIVAHNRKVFEETTQFIKRMI